MGMLTRRIAFAFALGFIFSIPWENITTVGTIGTLSRLIGMGAAGIWLVSVYLTHWLRKPHPFHIAALVFVLWIALGQVWSYDLGYTTQRTKTYLQLALVLIMVWDLTTTPQAFRWVLQSYIFGAYVSVWSTFSNFLAGQEFRLYAGTRYVATGFDANELGLVIALGIAPAAYLAFTENKGRFARLFQFINFLYIPAALLTIQLTASRGSLLSSLPALFFVFLILQTFSTQTRWVIFFAVIALLIAAQPYIPAETLARLATVFDSISSGDLGGRGALWLSSIPVFLANPIQGAGSGAVGVASGTGTYAHNTYLSVLSETGLVGFGIFALMLLIVLHQAYYQPDKWRSRMCLAIFVVWGLGVNGISWEFRKPTWLILNLIVIGANLLRQPDPDKNLDLLAQREVEPTSVREAI